MTDSLFWLVKQYRGATLNETFNIIIQRDAFIARCLHLAAHSCFLSLSEREETYYGKCNYHHVNRPVLIEDLIALKETTWFNPRTTTLAEGLPYVGLTKADVDDAHARLNRFAPYLAKEFPERLPPTALLSLNWSPFRRCKNGWRRNLPRPIPARCC